MPLKQRIEETRHEWEPRGNHCHLWLEHFLTGAAEVDSGEYKDWIDPLETAGYGRAVRCSRRSCDW